MIDYNTQNNLEMFHYIFFSSFTILLTNFLRNFNRDYFCLGIFIGLILSNTVRLGGR